MTKKTDHEYSFAGIVTIGPKGQIVIPAEVRQKMQLKSGDKLISVYLEEKRAVGFITEDQARSMVDRMGKRLDIFRALLGKRA